MAMGRVVELVRSGGGCLGADEFLRATLLHILVRSLVSLPKLGSTQLFRQKDRKNFY